MADLNTARGSPSDSAEARLVSVHLAEFTSLRQEISSRFDNQRQTFTYLFTFLGAILAVVASGKLGLDTRGLGLDERLLVLLPLVVAPLGFIFFDNELMIWGIHYYIGQHLSPTVSELVGQHKVLCVESRRFDYLNRWSSECHRCLSLGRWSLFVIPTVVPIAYAAVSAIGHPERWLAFPYGLLLMIDCVVAALLLWAIVMAVSEQNRCWRHRKQRKAVEARRALPRAPAS